MGQHGKRVEAYFAACSAGDAAEISRHFSPVARIYDTNHEPVVGREDIGQFWAKVGTKWGHATWHVDSMVEGGGRVAIEWSMKGSHQGRDFVVRGSEHYEFEGDLISEIRQYWVFDPQAPGGGLVRFPYPRDERFAWPTLT
jgi:hypothetical protein